MNLEDVFFSVGWWLSYFCFLLAAYPTTLITLALPFAYRRSVRRHMRRISNDESAVYPKLPPEPPDEQAPAEETGSVETYTFSRSLDRLVWSRVLVYTIAGIVGALCLAWIYFWIKSNEDSPLHFGILAYTFVWPVVPLLSRFDLPEWIWFLALVGYILVPLVHPPSYPEFLLVWTLYMGFPSVVIVILGLRMVRMVGPLVYIPALLATWGGLSALVAYVKRVSSSVAERGLEVHTTENLFLSTWDQIEPEAITLIGLITLVGFLLIAWALLKGVVYLYRMRWFSDWQLGVDMSWMVFILCIGIQLTAESGALAWLVLIAFVVYRSVVALGLKSVQPAGGPPHRLLLLRVFGRPKQSRDLFDVLALRWQNLGPIRIIASADLAYRTLEIQYLLQYMSGRLGRRFHKAGELVSIDFEDLSPDPDHRYRIEDFLCYADTWQEVLLVLLDHTDAVIMDLRGFQVSNQGCAFELSQIARRLSAMQFVGLIDDSTDSRALQETLNTAWAGAGKDQSTKVGFQLLRLRGSTRIDEIIALVHPA